MAEAKLPTRDEIAQLPRWAIVAFAARCARRVQPLFAQSWPDAPQHHVIAVEQAIALSEKYAGTYETKLLRAVRAAAAEVDAADFDAYASVRAAAAAAADAAETADAADFDAFMSASAAVDAARVAGRAVVAASGSAALAAADAVDAAADARSVASIKIVLSSMRNDYNQLLEASRREKWDDATPVPPSFFGPLEVIPSVPTDELLESDEHVAMVLQAFGEPGVSAGMLAEHLLAVYKALNQYTLAKYGRHLSRGRFRRLVLLHSGVPA